MLATEVKVTKQDPLTTADRTIIANIVNNSDYSKPVLPSDVVTIWINEDAIVWVKMTHGYARFHKEQFKAAVAEQKAKVHAEPLAKPNTEPDQVGLRIAGRIPLNAYTAYYRSHRIQIWKIAEKLACVYGNFLIVDTKSDRIIGCVQGGGVFAWERARQARIDYLQGKRQKAIA